MVNGEILRVCQEEHLLVKYYVIKDLILLKKQNMMNINFELFQLFINVLIKYSVSSAKS